MKLSKLEQESIILYNEEESTASILKMSRTVQSNLPKDFGKRVSGENHFLKGSLLTY